MPSLAKDYINYTVRHTGLVQLNGGRIELSEEGKSYLEGPNNTALFRILNENIIGFKETLIILHRKRCSLPELNGDLIKELHSYPLRWTTNAQASWRVKWLQAMGFASFDSHQYGLTTAGEELLGELGGYVPETTPSMEKQEGPRSDLPSSLREGILENLCGRLKATEHASSEPWKYEQAIAGALTFLGFDVTHHGKSGDTDVLAIAQLGRERYTIILDGKTTGGERVIERQISWPSLEDHRELHQADYTVIVGPDFAGGDLLERARKKYKVGLLETGTLTDLLTIHSRTPLTLLDLRDVFCRVGPINLKECLSLQERKTEYEKQLEILPKIFSELQSLEKAGDTTTASDLRWALGKRFKIKEIQWVLDLLELLGMVKRTEKEEYLITMMPEVAAAKLKAIANSIRPAAILSGSP